MFKFKDVEVTFDMRQLPFYDQEYLKTMCYETVNAKSYMHSGKSFNELYKNANNFTITPKELSVTLVGNISKIYDGAATATLSASKYSLSGVIDGYLYCN
jgi:hypothetical protein